MGAESLARRDTNKQPSGQAARYRHAEMRQTIHAVVMFYAAGCRSGHDPLAGIPAALLLANLPAVSGALTFRPDERMREHIAAGRARYISATMCDNVERDGSSWYSDPARAGGWTRNIDPDYAALISIVPPNSPKPTLR